MNVVTLCAHCALKALLAGEQPPQFNEMPEEHLARVHGDAEATQRERVELEAKVEERRALAKAARFN